MFDTAIINLIKRYIKRNLWRLPSQHRDISVMPFRYFIDSMAHRTVDNRHVS